MSGDWYDYQDEKTAPKPAYKRAMPKRQAPPAEPESQGMIVEEFDGSPSMIMRIVGKIRDLAR